jgi:4'-phosphopantetheinyl transferase
VIQVFLCALDFCIDRDVLLRELAPEERQRAQRFRRSRDRDRWVASRLFLRRCLANALATTPDKITLLTGINGKPHLTGTCGAPALRFNLSHSGSRAILALSDAAEVGIDIEFARHFPDMLRVANRVFTAGERAQLGNSANPDFARRFYQVWTCKEAVIKATGEGMAADLQAIEIDLQDDGQPRLIRYDGIPGELHLQQLLAGDGYVAALASQATARTMTPVKVTKLEPASI